MKKIILCLSLAALVKIMAAQQMKTIVLNPPDITRGLPVMTALSLRASATSFDTTTLKLQDVSDLLWAANGINRPESGKRTAPSAMNSQDIDLYAVVKSGAYLYNAKNHSLELIAEGDHRALVAGSQQNFANAPFFCVLVSDIFRFQRGEDSLKLVWAAEDAGIVSQNISIFCAAAGLATRPRAYMDRQNLSEVLRLSGSQHLMLNHPVGYKRD